MGRLTVIGAAIAATSLTALMVPSTGAAAGPRLAPRARVVAVDLAQEAGLGSADIRSWSAAPADYNLDGAQDVLIGHHFLGAQLWKNKGDGTYVRVARYGWPKVVDRHFCAWADVDANGRPDVYCASGRGVLNRVKGPARDNELWLQHRDGRFSEVETKWNAGDPCGRGRAVAFLDANGDRYPDLFVGNETPRKVDDRCDRSTSLPNEASKLFINRRGHGFRYAPKFGHFGAGPGSRCAEVLDFNGDGWDDLFTCRRIGAPQLYESMKGHGFRDVTPSHRFSQITDADVVDLQGDGDPDLVTSSKPGFAYYLNADGHFRHRRLLSHVRVGEGTSVAAGDADGDGDADVYAMVGNGAAGNPDDRIMLNDHLTFTPVRVPSAGGAADDVVALDPYGTGRADFLVLNGYNLVSRGPVQLIHLVGP